MKKLNKLEINPEKIVKNEELMILSGGDGYEGYEDACTCKCLDPVTGDPFGYVLSSSGNCLEDCALVFGWTASGYCAGL